MSDLFTGSALLISARSPFARRVRIAFREHSLGYTEEVYDVFNPGPELLAVNPLARVPAIRLSNGETIADSHAILEAFYDERSSPFRPTNAADRREAARWSGLAVGLCERIVEYYLETLRAPGTRDPEVLAEIDAGLARSLAMLEARLASRDTLLGQGRLAQCDFDLGSALAYLTLRHPMRWRDTHPACARYLDRLEARPSFRETSPPS